MKLFLYIIIIFISAQTAWAFDHQHSILNTLLAENVVWINSGNASQVRYAGFQKDHQKLKTYLNMLSRVEQKQFDAWTKPQQLAFLINAYNAFTIELILSRYPKPDSIKDLGSLLSSPWKKKFFTLLGSERNLDDIEHGMIRKKGVYDDPRIHLAVVCASVGCPALRNEAFTSDNLDAQLEDSLRRFLSDKSRNRYNTQSGVLEVSKIFDWYKDDFSSGYRGFASLQDFFSKYAELLAETPEDREKIRQMKTDIRFLDYDWNLNDIR